MAITMNVQSGPSGMGLNLNSWRGYSAYEIAVQNGFEGTETEWLDSLHGKDGLEASVNGLTPDETGAITITGENIPVSEQDTKTLSEIAVAVSPLAGVITVTEDGIDLNNRYIDNALFR